MTDRYSSLENVCLENVIFHLSDGENSGAEFLCSRQCTELLSSLAEVERISDKTFKGFEGFSRKFIKL